MALSANRHSERGQECFVEKTENKTMTQSEESITLVTSYRLPHHDSRSFTFVQPDILPFPVIQSFGKNTLRERWKPAMCHKAKNLLPWMTSYRFPHHNGRLFTFVQGDVLPFPVIQSFGKNTLREEWKPAMCHKAKNLLLWWRFTVFLTTVIDPSLSFRMTPYHGYYFISRPESG